jgi:hypothetical protein
LFLINLPASSADLGNSSTGELQRRHIWLVPYLTHSIPTASCHSISTSSCRRFGTGR